MQTHELIATHCREVMPEGNFLLGLAPSGLGLGPFPSIQRIQRRMTLTNLLHFYLDVDTSWQVQRG